MKLGCAEIDITPNIPILLGGYGARDKPGLGIAQPLKARSFFFDCGDRQLGLITAEIVLLSKEQADRVREEASRITGIPAGKIIVACSHTHSGPATRNPASLSGNKIEGFEGPDRDYLDFLVKSLAGSLLMAKEDLEEVRMGTASAEVENVGKNRRNPDLPVDNQLTVLAFAGEDGSLKAVLFNYACHPTVLGPDNLLVSPDFPGAAVEVVKKIYPGAKAAFINGAAGDISTRFTRREQSFAEVKRLGTILGGQVVSLVAQMDFVEVSNQQVDGCSLKIDVDFKEFPPIEELENEIQRSKEELACLEKEGAEHARIRIAQTALQGAQIQKLISERLEELEKKAEINIWRLGPVGLVSIPGELFSALGQKIKDNSPVGDTLVIGYANGHLGYIPDRVSYQQEGYEVLSTPLAPGFGEKIVEAVSGGWKQLGI